MRVLLGLTLCVAASGTGAGVAADAASLWVHRFGGTTAGQRVATGPSGEVVVAGIFSGATGFGGDQLTSAGSSDVYLASFDPSGAHRWSRRLGGTSSDSVSGLATDGSGAIVVAGSFGGVVDFGGGPLVSAGSADIYIASFSPSGAHLWSKRFGDVPGEIAGGVATDLGGNVFLTAYSGSSLDFGGGPQAVGGSLVSFDASGAHRWSKSFGLNVQGRHVATDPNGNIAVLGYLSGPADLGGGSLASAGAFDVLVASFAPSGAHRWSKAFGGRFNEQVADIATDTGGGVIVTGQFVDVIDFGGPALLNGQGNAMFAASFDLSGAHRWSTVFAGTWDQLRQGVAADPTGNVVVTGSFNGTTADCAGAPIGAGTHMFVTSYEPSGGQRWSRTFGDSSIGTDVSTDAGGNVVVTGSASDGVDFGGGPSSGGVGVVFAFRQDDIAPSSVLTSSLPIQTDPLLATGTVQGVTTDSLAGVGCVSVVLRAVFPPSGPTPPQAPSLACDALRVRCTWSVDASTWPASSVRLSGLYQVVVDSRDRYGNSDSSVVGTVLLV